MKTTKAFAKFPEFDPWVPKLHQPIWADWIPRCLSMSKSTLWALEFSTITSCVIRIPRVKSFRSGSEKSPTPEAIPPSFVFKPCSSVPSSVEYVPWTGRLREPSCVLSDTLPPVLHLAMFFETTYDFDRVLVQKLLLAKDRSFGLTTTWQNLGDTGKQQQTIPMETSAVAVLPCKVIL